MDDTSVLSLYKFTKLWCPLFSTYLRLIKQDGHFLLFGISENKLNCAPFKPAGIEIKRILIKNESKGDILAQLELLGISRDKLFPELDETAEFLKNKFKEAAITKDCT
jgi:hypothetical protein